MDMGKRGGGKELGRGWKENHDQDILCEEIMYFSQRETKSYYNSDILLRIKIFKSANA